MSKDRFLFCVKALILLSPLPFGCAGRVWSPLFYLVILVISALGLDEIRSRVSLLYEKQVGRLGLLFFGFLVFQMVPLPRFILKIVSPASLAVLDDTAVEPFRFHALSLVPADTLMFLMHLFVLVFFFYVLVNLELKKVEVYSMVNVVMASAFFQVLLGLARYFLKSDRFFLFFHEMEKPVRLVTGTFRTPDHFSFYLEMAFPLLLGLFLVKVYVEEPWESIEKVLWQILFRRRMVLIYVTLIPVFAFGIWMAKALTGTLVMMLSIFMLVIGFGYYRLKVTGQSNPGFRWVALAIIFISVLYALQLTMARVNRPDKEGNIRAVSWKEAGTVFSRFPVAGVGYGNYRNISYTGQSREGGSRLHHVSNDFLEHLAEGGIIGAGLFFAFLGLFLFSLFRMWAVRHHPEVRTMGLALLVCILAALFHGLFDYAFRVPANGFLFVLILGLALKMALYRREARRESE